MAKQSEIILPAANGNDLPDVAKLNIMKARLKAKLPPAERGQIDNVIRANRSHNVNVRDYIQWLKEKNK